jgi:hypothetical protein
MVSIFEEEEEQAKVGHGAYAASGTFWLPSHGAFPPRAVYPYPYPAISHAALSASPTLTDSRCGTSAMVAAAAPAHLLRFLFLMLMRLSIRFRVCTRAIPKIHIDCGRDSDVPCAVDHIYRQSAACRRSMPQWKSALEPPVSLSEGDSLRFLSLSLLLCLDFFSPILARRGSRLQ